MKKKSLGASVVAALSVASLSLMLCACGDESSSSGPDNSAVGGESSAAEDRMSSSEMPIDTTCCKIKDKSSSSAKDKSSSSVSPKSSESHGHSSEALVSSSSAESDETDKSSSSVSMAHQQAKDLSAECDKNSDDGRILSNTAPTGKNSSDFVVDLNDLLDVSAETLPVARKYVGEDGFVTIVVEQVMMPCASVFERIDVYAGGDTLYVDPVLDQSGPVTNCLCQTRVSFKIEKDSGFTGATFLMYDRSENLVYQLQDGSYESDEMNQLKKSGFVLGTCMNDTDLGDHGPKAGAPNEASRKAAPVELPEATLTSYASGESVLEVNNVMDYCKVTAMVSQKMSGDTLFLDYYNMGAVAKCICLFDSHKFLIAPENTGAKIVSFKGSFFKVVRKEDSAVPE